MKTLIVGKGKVGEATAASLTAQISFHDPAKGFVVNDFNAYQVIIVCVDSLRKGPYDHTDISAVLDKLHHLNYRGIVCIRTTVSPEFVQRWRNFYNLRFVMFPEFMRQTDDLKMDDPWIVVLGGDSDDTAFISQYLIDCGYCTDYDKYHFVTDVEAALIKLCQNAGLASKVIFYNMVNEMCEKYGLDFDRVRKGVGADKRVGMEYSVVPSPDDGQKGFKGHCLPKDVACLASIETHDYFQTLLKINRKLGRE